MPHVNPRTYAGFHRGIGDPTHTTTGDVLEILLPGESTETYARQLHIAQAGDADTDWAIAAQSHPTVYIHSVTTPTTDYLRLGGHDGTTAVIDVVGGTTLAFQIDGGTSFSMDTDGFSSDVIIGSGFGLNVGSATQSTISDGDGTTNLIPEVQAHGIGTAFAGGAVMVASYNTTNDRTVSPKLILLKGGAATQVATTAVADNEVVGSIIAYGSDATDFESPVASIEFVINGSVGTGDMPGSIEFYTTADSGETLTLSFSVDTDQNIYIRNNNGMVIGHTAQIAVADQNGDSITPEVQVIGTGNADAALLIFQGTTSATNEAGLILVKSGNSTIGSFTIVTDDEDLGSISWNGDDGVDYLSVAAKISAQVDGTPGSNDMPGRLVFYTTADGAATTTERWRLTSVGYLTSLAADAANAANVDGAVLATGGIAFTDVANAWIDDSTQGNGTVAHLIGNETITTSSDLRLKRDIEDTVVNATELFRQMRVVDYTWRENYVAHKAYNARGRWMGMIAQEVVDIAPWIINAPGTSKDCSVCRAGVECDEHVNEDGSPQWWFVNYDYLVPTVVKGLQELDSRLLQLEGFQEHTNNGWLKEQFTDLVENDQGFRSWAREKLAV